MATSTEAEAVAGLEPREIVNDYRIAYRSRQVSVLARGEVMLGRAMFGIFGDGKEVAQVALSRAIRAGDVGPGHALPLQPGDHLRRAAARHVQAAVQHAVRDVT
jgi:hypothetical protein